MQVQQCKAREVASAHVERIGWVARRGHPRHIVTVGGRVVLHADGVGYLRLQRVEEGFVARSLKDGADRVEVPVVVVPERAGQVAMPFRLLAQHPIGFIRRGVVDAGSCLEQHPDRGLLLVCRERGRFIVDAQLLERVVEPQLALRDGNSNQCTREALAYGVEVGLARYVAPLGHDESIVDDHA